MKDWIQSNRLSLRLDQVPLKKKDKVHENSKSPVIHRTGVPDFLIPVPYKPRREGIPEVILVPESQEYERSYSSDSGISFQKVVNVEESNSDPQSYAAMGLLHFRSQTSYGFGTLREAPHTLRRESLFHDTNIPLVQPSPGTPWRSSRLTVSVRRQLKSNEAVNSHRNSTRRKMSNIPVVSPLSEREWEVAPRQRASTWCGVGSDNSICRLFGSHTDSGLRGLPIQCLQTMSGNDDDVFTDKPGSVSNRFFKDQNQSPQISESGIRQEKVPTLTVSSSYLKGSFESILPAFDEFGCVEFSVNYCNLQKCLQIRLIRAVNLSCDEKYAALNTYAKVTLMPGKRRTKRSTLIKGQLDPVFLQDFTFEDIKAHELGQIVIRIKISHKKKILRRDEVLGVVDIPIADLDLDHEERIWRSLRVKNKDLGYLKTSLTFNPRSEQLKVTVIEACNLPTSGMLRKKIPDTYIKINLAQHYCRNEAKKKSDLCKNSIDPKFNANLTFKISPKVEDIKYTVVTFTVCRRNKTFRDGQIGQVKVGFGATEDTELSQWRQVIQNPGQAFTAIHKIMEIE